MSSGLASRTAALDVLHHVLDRKQPHDEALSAVAGVDALSVQDRAFMVLMVKTALRRLGQCDALINEWMERPLPQSLRKLHRLLQLGLTQILWLDVPHHAAVHTTVELAKEAGFSRQAKLVNAILQRCVREGKETIATHDAARLNTPDWLWESWVEAHGEDGARAFAELNLKEPALDLTVKPGAEHPEGERLANGTLRIREHAGLITELPGFAEGAWWVQDAAASMPAKLLIEALGDVQGKRIADLCAAPGGKTAQLAQAGATVIAIDIERLRMKRVVENLTRLKLKAECMVTDAAKWKPADAPDAILLDAPCSATGTIRRHPEIAWIRHPKDVLRLVEIQKRLLKHALSLLKPGGVLAYAVCSVQPEEGPQQLEWIKNHSDFSVVSEYSHASLSALLGGEADGFYIALIRKV